MVPTTSRRCARLLASAYLGLQQVVAELTPHDLARATGATEWRVVDLLFHLLLDAQRVLVTLASPTAAAPDRDAVSYWRDFPPGRAGATEHAAFVRRSVEAYSEPTAVVDQFRTTLPAAARAAGAAEPAMPVQTQGHVLTVADFCSTAVVEATIHHLDLIADLPGVAGPEPELLAETRRVLTGLLGAPFPASWSDLEVVRRATGRAPTRDDRLPLIS